MQTPDLCEICSKLMRQYLSTPVEDIRQYHVSTWSISQSAQELQTSALQGCRFCRLRLYSLKQAPNGPHAVEDVRAVLRLFRQKPSSLYIKCNWQDGKQLPMSIFDVLRDDEMLQLHNVGDGLRAIERSRSSGSLESFDLARNWLRECSSTHKLCRRFKSTMFVPTRLVNLGHAGQAARVETMDTGKILPYLTLSHCWGQTVQVKLMKNNYKELHTNIVESRLSLTFQHAFKIARELGILYIWIDSLCIIQDDAADWKREAALMDQVYLYGICNIVAAKGSDGSTGCFSERDLGLHRSRVEVENGQGSVDTLHVFERILLDLETAKLSLFQRAWCIQETILAPRKLNYSATQMIWECKEKVACEAFPSSVPGELVLGNVHHINQSICKDLIQSPEAGKISDLPLPRRIKLWSSILYIYSGSILTFPQKDRLAAIHGMAKALVVDELFYTGLWSYRFLRQLLWTTDRAERRMPGMPSWSWASVTGACMLMFAFQEEVGVTRFGSVSELSEVLAIDMADEPAYDTTIKFYTCAGTIRLKGPLFPRTFAPAQLPTFDQSNEASWYKDDPDSDSRVFFDVEIKGDGTVYYIGPIVKLAVDSGPDEIQGIIYERTPTPGQYQRVGCFRLFLTEDQQLSTLFQDEAHMLLPDDAYEALGIVDSNGHQQYQYSVI